MKEEKADRYEDSHSLPPFTSRSSIVLISQRFLNRNPQHWEKPDDFIPERFMGVQVQMVCDLPTLAGGVRAPLELTLNVMNE